MKGKISKRLLPLILAVIMVVSVLPMGVFEAEAAYTYDPIAALDYAKAHWNDGKGKCAEFVSDCLRAGGFYEYYHITAATLGQGLQKYGKKIKCNTTPGNIIKASDFEGQLTPGDVIIWEGSSWPNTSGHATIYYRTDEQGYIRIYQHNKARQDYRSQLDSGARVAYAIHLDSSYVPPPKTPGTYCSNNCSVNIRTEPSVSGKKIGCVPKYTNIYVTEIRNGWGKCIYNGVTGWTCLDYYTQVSIPDAGVPRINEIATKDVPQGTLITVNWAAVSNATKYKISVNGGSEIDIGNNTTYSLKLDQAKTYTFKVQAYNSANKASGWSNTVSCTAHAPCTVTFADSDGTVFEPIKVDYGKDAFYNAPSKDGFTFQGWDGSTQNITKDVTLRAKYKRNTYYVKFWGADNKQIGTTKQVLFGDDATPPTDTQAPAGYKFIRWSSEDYKNVFTKAEDKTINIYAVYEWANKNIPLTCQITEAYRDKYGYHVKYDIVNHDSDDQTGRAIISLKTEEDKLIYTTESKTFALAGNSSKTNIDEFFECDQPASKIEIIIVDSYMNGTPIAENVSATVRDGLGWSDWMDADSEEDIPTDAEKRTLYRYSDKITTTASTKTLNGWTYAGVNKETVGTWSNWQDAYIAPIQSDSLVREVKTQTVTTYNSVKVYNYYRYAAQQYGGYSAVGWENDKQNDYYYTTDHELEYGGISSDDGVTAWYKFWYYNENVGAWKYIAVYKCGTGVNTGGTYVTYNQVANGTKTQYKYRDTTYTYNFYKWKAWSDWSTKRAYESSTREIETQLQYRTFNGSEDTSGETIPKSYYVGTEFAGKWVTLFAYKFDAASDYTDEFVGQTKVDTDGYCHFKIKLREERSSQTGDITIALGIEGTTNTFIVDTLDAPKPIYKVRFLNSEKGLIEEQEIEEGQNAVPPSYVPNEGYDFMGWSESLTNIRQDMEISAVVEKRTYQVIFIDWETQLFEVRTFEHGAQLKTPDIAGIDGLIFTGWDKINEGETIVKSNMVVTAQYEKEKHTVTFYDFDGNPLDVQIVEDGDTALPPEDIESDDGKNFAGWFNPDDYQYVEDNEHIYPSFYYDETTPIPEVNYISGEYGSAIELTLTTDDENAVVYYYFGDDQSTEAIYTEPITIDKSTTVTYYATSFGKNDSEAVTEYYCINSDEVSGWMLKADLPADVLSDTDYYIVESAKGYRYKEIQTTSSESERRTLINNGWKWEDSAWSEYTAWQDEEIVANDSLINFTVYEREVDDTSVTWYKYTRYKYTDSNGIVQYSPTAVEGYECTEETLRIPDKLSIAGFLDDDVTTYYEYNGERWFKRTSAPGLKTQYCSRYMIGTFYKWTEWGTTAPATDEIRTYESDTVYRYSVQNYHIVDIINDYSELPVTSIVKSGTAYDTSTLETEGYTFDGLYADAELTKPFGATTPITESVTLYAKYTPKKYTVRFQMQDGTTIPVQMQDGTEAETQQVDFLGSATEPEKDAIPDWTFVSWDKDFDCITGDTVITGKYIKNTEYAYINFDRTSADMYQGMSFTLVYLITPLNLANEVIEWSTSDPSIATVDDKGNVTAVAAGEVTITATVVKSREKASCTISVAADKANFIVLKSDTYLGYDSLGYLRGVKLNTTTSALSREFTNVTLKYKNMSGTELGENSLIGTGSTIMLYNGSTLVDSKVAIVTGDMTGDGIINNRDVVMMNKYLLNKVEAQECQTIATDVNGDGYVNNKDAAMVARYMVGKENF